MLTPFSCSFDWAYIGYIVSTVLLIPSNGYNQQFSFTIERFWIILTGNVCFAEKEFWNKWKCLWNVPLFSWNKLKRFWKHPNIFASFRFKFLYQNFCAIFPYHWHCQSCPCSISSFDWAGQLNSNLTKYLF
jgi:hypothetical protein